MSDEKTQMNAYERPDGSIQVPTRGDTGEGYGQASPAATRVAHLEGLLRAADAALEALGVPNHGEPIAERVRVLGDERDAARAANEAHALAQIRSEPLSDAELAAHRGLDAPRRADDEPDPETGWTRAEMRAASSPATRDFLAAMGRLRDGGSEADGLEALKTFLRAEHAR